MNLYYLIILLVCIAAPMIIWALLHIGKPVEPDPDTRDDFTPSMARWGYLHDKRGE